MQLTQGANKDKESPHHLDQELPPEVQCPWKGSSSAAGVMFISSEGLVSHLRGKEGVSKDSTCPHHTVGLQITTHINAQNQSKAKCYSTRTKPSKEQHFQQVHSNANTPPDAGHSQVPTRQQVQVSDSSNLVVPLLCRQFLILHLFVPANRFLKGDFS